MQPRQTLSRFTPLKFSNPGKIAEVTAALASGLSQTQTAELTGISRPTVNILANKPDIKAKIEAIQSRIINEAYEDVASNLVEAVKDVRRLTEPDPVSRQRRDQGIKTTWKIAESMGILPSHSQSILVQQVFNQTNNFLSERADHLLDMAEGEVIDCE